MNVMLDAMIVATRVHRLDFDALRSPFDLELRARLIYRGQSHPNVPAVRRA
jgi:hypothetical protein